MQHVTWIRASVETDARYGRTPREWKLDDHWITYQDTANVQGVQRFQITLQGRSYREGGTPQPWREVIRKGDFVWAEGHTWTGLEATSAQATLVDGLVVDVQDTETLTESGYEATTTLICESMLTILARDAVAYWMYFGTAKGFNKARAELPYQDVSGRLDKVFKNYLERVAFTSEIWERDGKTLKDRLSFILDSLTPSVPPRLDLTIAEGTHFAILAQHLDAPLHELYGVTLPTSRVRGATVSTASVTRGETPGGTTLILRPAPYPFGTPAGTGDTSEWQALALHDHSEDHARPYGTRSSIEGLNQGHYNFWLVTPRAMFMTDRNAMAAGIAVHNPTARSYFAHAPMRISTAMLIDEGRSDSDLLTTSRELTWRLAGQHNKLEDYLNGTVSLPFAPKILPGERLRVRLPYGDTTKRLEAHVQGRTHSLHRERGGTTTVTFDRGLEPSLYADPAYFVDGLEAVDLRAQADAVSIKDGLEQP